MAAKGENAKVGEIISESKKGKIKVKIVRIN